MTRKEWLQSERRQRWKNHWKYRQFEEVLDLDKNKEVTQDEIAKATEILEKAKRREQRKEQLRNLNSFIMKV